MEFQIRNSYIKKFLSGFSHQNELKIIKYLTIAGIHYLETCNKFNISFAELKKIAKNLSKNCEKEQDKFINKELNIIKKELVKLTQKFEEKLKETQKLNILDIKSTEENLGRSSSVPKELDSTNNVAQKPPSRWKEGKYVKSDPVIPSESNKRRSNSIDSSNPLLKHSKLSDYITPKPTEITLPLVDPRENKNYITRHHLDDSQAKSTFIEQGFVSFSGRKEQRGRPDTHESTKILEKEKSISINKTNLEKNNIISDHFSSKPPSSTVTASENKVITFDERSRSRSPKFAFSKEETFSKIGIFPARFRDSEINPTQSSAFPNSSKLETIPKQPIQSKPFITSYRTQGKNSREKTRTLGRSSNRSHLNQTHVVESKIRDEVKYHKELSKQYKKMRQSIQEYTENVNEKFSNASSSLRREKEKFVLIEKENQRLIQIQPFGQNSTHKPGGLLESTSSPQKSLYFKPSASQNSNLSLVKSRRSDFQDNQENLSQSKTSDGKLRGGMLDIANSFLNSPFMQHLSNLDGKSSQMSPGSSMNIKTNRNEYEEPTYRNEGGRVHQTGDRYSPKKKVTYANSQQDEGSRNQEANQNFSKYSEWVGNFKNDRADSSYLLKESEKKRYDHNGSLQQSKNDTASLTSSNFSNFLNDEMKGFFQKETLGLKKPKTSKSVVRGSFDSLPSVKPLETTYYKNREINSSYVKKKDYITPPTTNPQHQSIKSYIGESIDNGNVFKNERMSVTHLLNTS